MRKWVGSFHARSPSSSTVCVTVHSTRLDSTRLDCNGFVQYRSEFTDAVMCTQTHSLTTAQTSWKFRRSGSISCRTCSLAANVFRNEQRDRDGAVQMIVHTWRYPLHRHLLSGSPFSLSLSSWHPISVQHTCTYPHALTLSAFVYFVLILCNLACSCSYSVVDKSVIYK